MQYPKTDLASRNAQRILDYALSEGATEIYFELGDPAKIRFRTDGLLHDVFDVDAGDLRTMISTITKYACVNDEGLGQLTYYTTQGAARFSAYHYSTPDGEHLALRPVQQSGDAAHATLNELGLAAADERLVSERLPRHGIVIVSGPSESCIRTTLVSLAHALEPEHRSIVMIDAAPVHTPLADMQQVRINRHNGFDA